MIGFYSSDDKWIIIVSNYMGEFYKYDVDWKRLDIRVYFVWDIVDFLYIN